MDIPTTLESLTFQFNNLLLDLDQSWASDEIAFVRDLIDHGEPAEALSNLLGIIRLRQKQLTPAQDARVAALAAALKLPTRPAQPAHKLPFARPA